MKNLLTIILLILLSLTLSAQSLTWQKTSPDYIINATSGTGYMIMTNSSTASLKLPQNPSDGDVVGFMDVSGTFGTNALTVDPGNIPVNGSRGSITYNDANTSVTLVYTASPYGWKVLSSNIVSSNSETSNISTPKDFGAVGDGITDDYSALTDFFENIIENNVKGEFTPGKTYYTSEHLMVAVGGDIDFDGKGCKLIRDYDDFSGDDVNYTYPEIIYFAQSSSFSKTLQQTAKKDSFLIKASSYDDIVIGMGVKLLGGEYAQSSATFNKGMMNKVKDTLTGNGWVRLVNPIPYDFTTGEITAFQFFDVHNISIKNFRLDFKGIIDSLDVGAYSIQMGNLFDAKFENITIYHTPRFGWRIRDCYGLILDKIIINQGVNIQYGGDGVENGIYGLSAGFMVNSKITNSEFSTFSVSTTSGSYPNYSNVWDNCTFSATGTMGFDSHGDYRNNRILNSRIYGAYFDFGEFIIDNCELFVPKGKSAFLSVGEGGVEKLTKITVNNCDIYGADNNFVLETSVTAGYMDEGNLLSFVNNRFHGDKWQFNHLSSVFYDNNKIVYDDGAASYDLPNTPERLTIPNSYYGDLTPGNGIPTTYDIAADTALSILVKAKLVDGDYRCFAGEESGSAFWFRLSSNDRLELVFKGADAVQKTVSQPIRTLLVDTLWHTWGFVLYNDTVKFYLDGFPFFSDTTTFTSIQNYPRLFRFGARGNTNEINGGIVSGLLFNRPLSSLDMAKYTMNPRLAVNDAQVALLPTTKTATVWLDASGNGYDGTVGAGITLNNLPMSISVDRLLNITPTSSAPSNPSEGTIYSNSTDNHIYIYLNSTWKQLDN